MRQSSLAVFLKIKARRRIAPNQLGRNSGGCGFETHCVLFFEEKKSSHSCRQFGDCRFETRRGVFFKSESSGLEILMPFFARKKGAVYLEVAGSRHVA